MQIVKNQAKISPTGTAKATSITFDTATVVGRLIVVCISQSGFSLGAAVSDNYGNAYTARQSSTGGTNACFVYTARIAAGGAAHTITVTTGATRQRLAIIEFTNVDVAAPVASSSTAGGSSTTPDAGAPGSAVANQYTIGVVTHSGTTTAITPTAPGFTIVEEEDATTGIPLAVSGTNPNTAAAHAAWTLAVSKAWRALSLTLNPRADDPPFINLPYAFAEAPLPAAPTSGQKVFTRTRATHADGSLSMPQLGVVLADDPPPWYANPVAGEQPRFYPPGSPGGCHLIIKFTDDTTAASFGDPTAWWINDTPNAPTGRPNWFRGVALTDTTYIPGDGTYYTIEMEDTGLTAPVLPAGLYPQLSYIPPTHADAFTIPGGRPLAPRREDASTL